MTELSGPFDNGTFGEDAWARAARLWVPNCVEAGYDDELSVVANGGLQVALKYGNAAVQGFFYRNQDAYKTFTAASTSGTAGQSRNDLVVLRLDRVANTVTALMLTGTFASTPVDPALTQATDTSGNTYDLPIARVVIAANATTVGTITMLRPLYKAGYPSMLGVKKTSTAGTASGTALMDTNLGYQTITVTDARLWYRIKYRTNLTASTTGQMTVNLRVYDSGSAANPTTSSSQVSFDSVNFTAATGQLTTEGYTEDLVQLAVGTHTFGAAYSVGAGTPTISPTGLRYLSIECVGYVGIQ